jgi:lipopolysaccharide export system permease protein
MRRLGFYLFRQHVTAFLFATAAVSMVVLFTQLFRLLSLVIDNSATLFIFFDLLALSVPTFLPLVLPLALGIATLFTYHKLAVDSELVVMRAAGLSPMRLAAPAFLLTAIITIVCFILTLWVTPAANRNLVSLQYKVRDSYAVFLSHPGVFNDITDGLTFYARRRGSGGALEGILIHDVRAAQAPVTIMADTGQVMDNGGQPQIVVFKGERQEWTLRPVSCRNWRLTNMFWI